MSPEENSRAITVAYGDGIGPEIMKATLQVLEAAGATLKLEVIEIGQSVYGRGVSAGIDSSSWQTLRETGVFLKSPITTPQGGGYKSLNVTVRKTLGLYANVRPCVAYAPFVKTRHPEMNVVIVRENEEDLYAGIEHRQTQEVTQCLKLITRPGCEKIVRYAFEYARQHGRKKITCMTKDNIMKMTDGLFHRVFDEMAPQYPDIQTAHMIIDIGAARLADTPEMFDVIVAPNLYGDIISDIAAQVAGSVGLAASVNLGEHMAMFEAIHGSAPDIAGQDIANPSGLLLAGVQMLVHIGQPEVAERVHNAWLCTLEQGLHTADIYTEGVSAKKVGTREFADAVVARLGQMPETLAPVHYSGAAADTETAPMNLPAYVQAEPVRKDLVGIDVFLDWTGGTPAQLAEMLNRAVTPELPLIMVTNRGVKVWPGGQPETFCTDHWRCRFSTSGPDQPTQSEHLVTLLNRIVGEGLDFIKCENLYCFDGQPGYALGQGQ